MLTLHHYTGFFYLCFFGHDRITVFAFGNPSILASCCFDDMMSCEHRCYFLGGWTLVWLTLEISRNVDRNFIDLRCEWPARSGEYAAKKRYRTKVTKFFVVLRESIDI